jgi:hypothetical protein
LRVSGWAVDASQEPAHLLVITTDGRIAGFAIGGIQLSIAGDRAFMKKAKFTDWSGAARAVPGIRFMEVYAVDNHHPQELCYLATARVPEN